VKKLDQPAAIDGPQQTGTVERAMAVAADQGNSVPTQCGGAFCPTTGGQELGVVRHELPPTVRRDVRWCGALAEMADALDPSGGMRGAPVDDCSTTSGEGCFSRSQDHLPADPNPL